MEEFAASMVDSVHLCMSENKNLMGIRVLIFTKEREERKRGEIKVSIVGIEEGEGDGGEEREREAFIIISQERKRVKKIEWRMQWMCCARGEREMKLLC